MDLKTIHIVSSSFLIREGLKSVINGLTVGFIVEESCDWSDFLENYKGKTEYQTIFLDLRTIPRTNRLNLFNQIINEKISILLLHSDEEEVNDLGSFEVISYKISKELLEKKLSELLLNGENNKTENTVLSDRELMVLKEVALGLTNKEISDKLFISMHTVITHRKNITAKLGIKTISGLTVYALINNLINPTDMNN